MSNAGTQDDLVILIHGTFASDRDGSDVGRRWWQRGSEAWTALAQQLPPGCSLPDESMRLFHWSGKNSQAERLAAANSLLAMLLELERSGRGYHLVGHSHGGSVIWEALVNSVISLRNERIHDGLARELRGRGVVSAASYSRHSIARKIRAYSEVSTLVELGNLKSWTTVGTPFLHYLPSRRAFSIGWPSMRLSLQSVSNKYLPFVAFFLALGTMILGLYLASMVKGSENPAPIIVGSIALVFLSLYASRVLDLRFFASNIISRERAHWAALRTFGSRWLGLWAPGDEAIGALSRLAMQEMYDYEWLCQPVDKRPESQQIEARRLPRIPIRFNVPEASVELVPNGGVPFRWRSLFSPLYYPAVAVANRFIAPLANNLLGNILLRTAQGTDLPGTVLAYMSTTPVPIGEPVEGLPISVAERLERNADQMAAQVGPQMRRAVALKALDGLPAVFDLSRENRGSAQTSGLVHTAYFDDPDILQLISMHIERSRISPEFADDVPGRDELSRWMEGNSRVVQSRFEKFLDRV